MNKLHTHDPIIVLAKEHWKCTTYYQGFEKITAGVDNYSNYATADNNKAIK